MDIQDYYIQFLPKVPFQFLEKISSPTHNTTIMPNGFHTIHLRQKENQEISHVIFVDPSQEQILDSFSFGKTSGSGSYSRYPDGGLWQEYLANPTPVNNIIKKVIL